jgi:hypothetical protein
LLDHINFGHYHSVRVIQDLLLIDGQGGVALVALDNALFPFVIGNVLGVGSHVLDLVQGQLENFDWMLSLGERGYQLVSLSEVSDGVEADHDVLGEEGHQAISVVDDISSLVFCLESYSFIWMVSCVDGNVVKLGNKFVNDVKMTSV